MSEWPILSIGDLFEIAPGKAMSAAARAGREKTPFLRTSNVLWDRIDLSIVDEMAIPAEELRSKLLLPGDLLVCEGGEIGRAAIWNGEREVMSFQNHIHRLRPLRDDIEPHFYVYFLQAAFTQLGIFEGAGNTTTIPNLSRNRLASLEVPVPTLEEQQRIVTALTSVREAIQIHELSSATASDLKRAAMRALFTQGTRGDECRESVLGPVPASWEVVEFGSVREWLQYGTSTRCTYEVTDFPVLRIPNIKPGKVDSQDIKYGSLTSDDASRYKLENGDLLFIRTNGVIERLGSCAVYAGKPSGALFASYLIRARLKLDEIDPYFVAYFFASDTGTAMVTGRATPAADGKYNLNTAAIDAFPIPLPPLDEQRQIVEVLASIDRKIDLHNRKSKTLEQLYRSLLWQLMTRRIQAADLDVSTTAPIADKVAS